MRRDCVCPRVKHKHGTEAGYTEDNCRCFPCALARHRYTAALRAGLPPERRTATVHGTRRRLQALTALGWSPPELAARCGLNIQTVQRLRINSNEGRSVLFQTRDEVSRLYDALWATPATGKHAKRMRNLAARNGWVPPLAWDDDDIDRPDAEPDRAVQPTGVDVVAVDQAIGGRRVELTRAELVTAVRQMTDAGRSASFIAAQLGINERLVTRYRTQREDAA